MRGGRQIGKSMTAAKRIIHLAHEYPGETHLIIAASERQENYLLDKVKLELGKRYPYQGRPTTTKLVLENDTIIYKFPVGKTGVYVEGLSNVAFLWVDEAIHMSDRVNDSVIPMLAEPRKRGLGWINYLSATLAKPKGNFFRSFNEDRFYKVIQKAEDQPHISKEFLREEYRRLGAEMYGVVYDGDFSIKAFKYFPEEKVLAAVKFKIWDYKKNYNPRNSHYLGIDPAGAGKALCAFVTGETYADRIRIPHYETLKTSDLFQMRSKTIELNRYFKYKKIFIDPRGLGQGITDVLKDHFKGKVRPLDNSEAGLYKRVLKEDLYSNAKRLLELEKVDIPDDPIFIKAICDVEWDDSKEKIIGTDIGEAFVRACWGMREKSYKVNIRTF